jgi:hypothetical protein
MRTPTRSLGSFPRLFLIAIGFVAIESSSPAATLVQESAYLLPSPPAGRPTGVGYFPAQQSLVISANLDQPGQNGFARINTAGVSLGHGYYQNGSQYLPIPASGSETKITVVRDPGNAWIDGTVIYGDRIPFGGGSMLCLRIVRPSFHQLPTASCSPSRTHFRGQGMGNYDSWSAPELRATLRTRCSPSSTIR